MLRLESRLIGLLNFANGDNLGAYMVLEITLCLFFIFRYIIGLRIMIITMSKTIKITVTNLRCIPVSCEKSSL